MGCHTWFSRPITDEEFKKMKEYAPREIYHLTGNSQENIENGSGLYTDVIKYIDTFRVPNYPRKIIRSRRDLRRFLRKRYFKLTDKQLERVSQFFIEYPGGVITFG